MNACAYIGLGANLGEARETVLAALVALQTTAGITDCQHARLYASDPVEAMGPVFVNTVVRIVTTLAPICLLDALQAIEQQHGRARPYRNAPRTLDLDLLWYDGINISTPRLILPHPRMHLRAFVLRPLQELAPAMQLEQGSLDILLSACSEQKIWPLQDKAIPTP
jgi:2-amino-4-hydroxy-6-hydroxymethyldihydropteridine diphosphokinase